MKLFKSFIITCCTAALLLGYSLRAADEPTDKHKGCCPATVEGEKKCDHACCKKAAEEGKICTKCHKDVKKEEAK
jgi:hypothetical protein